MSFASNLKRRLSLTIEDEIVNELSQTQAPQFDPTTSGLSDARKSADYTADLSLEECPPLEVCVFTSRAQCVRQISLKLPPLAEGQTRKNTLVIISNLPASCDDSSIRISKKAGTATILEVSMENMVKEILLGDDSEDASPEEIVKRKKEIITNLNKDLKNLEQEQARIEKEKAWLKGFASLQTHPKCKAPLNPPQVLTTLKYLRETSLKNDERLAKIAQSIAQIKERIGSLVKIKAVKSVYFLLGNAEGELSFTLSYLVNQASWIPSYDIRVNSQNLASLELSYQGIVTNNSGDHWRDVRLSLSTAQPHVAGSPPVLRVTNVNFRTESSSSFPEDEDQILMESKFSTSAGFFGGAGRANVHENATSTKFVIPRKVSVESDGRPHKVAISEIPLTGEFSFTIIPKLNRHAFLRNKIVNHLNFPLLAGKASVFMDTTFVCSSEIKTTLPGETLSLYLGADEGVVVDFKEVLERQNRGTFSKTLVIRYTHTMTVRNTKEFPIHVALFDQLPKSANSSIKVTVEKPKLEAKEVEGCAYLNNDNNVRWLPLILPGKIFTAEMVYVIEHPADEEITFS